MSMSEGVAPCVSGLENDDTAHAELASVTEAETVQNTNVNSNTPSHEDHLNDEDLLKGLLTDTFCQVCDAVLLFESQRISHYEGKKHAQRVRIYLQAKKAENNKQNESSNFQTDAVNPDKFCELCNMVFSSPVVAKSHYEGKVHAKNMRKNDTMPSTDIRTTAGSVVLPVPAVESAEGGKVDQEQNESPASSAQEVNLNDPDKYCKLCAASFNNPVMAQQHYSGRKHQRNQARQEMLSKLSLESEHASSLTCPVCNVILDSVEMYQAHMQSNKHLLQKKKMIALCRSQKKVYDSFQDELADYIQVQKARGLEPKRGPGPETQEEEEEEEEEDRSELIEEETEVPRSHLPPPPRPPFRPPHWRPPFQPRTGRFGHRGRFPVQPQWGQGYSPYPPPLIPGLTGRSLRMRRRPDSFSSSSSSSDSSSYSSSSSSSSSSDSSMDRRRRRKKRQERVKRKLEQDDDPNSDERRKNKRRRGRDSEGEQGHSKKAKRQRPKNFGEERETHEEKERRKRREKRNKEGGSSEEDEHRHKRRVSKKSRRQKDGHGRRHVEEEEEGEFTKEPVEERMDRGDAGAQSERVQAIVEEHTKETHEFTEDRPKHRKEKKKAKGKVDEVDKRTEEEKLWDETILGFF